MTDGQYLYHIVQYYSWMQRCQLLTVMRKIKFNLCCKPCWVHYTPGTVYTEKPLALYEDST